MSNPNAVDNTALEATGIWNSATGAPARNCGPAAIGTE